MTSPLPSTGSPVPLNAGSVFFMHPGDLNTRTGGYLYDKRLVRGLRDLGRRIVTVKLSERFPYPLPTDISEADRLLEALPDGSVVIIDGLAFGALPGVARKHGRRLLLVALVHHALADETGLSAEAADTLFHGERDALANARHVICTSDNTARRLADFGVSGDRVTSITPGVDPGEPSLCERPDGVTRLVTVGTLTRRKGYDVLVDALRRISDLPWTLTAAGSDLRDTETAAALRAQIAKNGLADRIVIKGELDDEGLDAVWRSSDLFVFASHYEGYGMVIAEAVARGLPIVTTRAGAVVDTAPPAASVLTPTGDPAALAEALRSVLTNRSLYDRLRTGALTARAVMRRWDDVAIDAERLIDRISSEARKGPSE